MIQTLKKDEDDNSALEFDLEGIDYFIDGLNDLRESPIGTVLTTPTLWENSAPWWRFWNRKPELVVGEMRLRRVA